MTEKKRKKIFKREIIGEGCLNSAVIEDCDPFSEKRGITVYFNSCGESMRGSWLHEKWSNTKARVVLEWLEPENSENHKSPDKKPGANDA